MTGNPTVSALRTAAEITDDEIDAVLADRADDAYPLADGWSLDLISAVAAHKAAQDALLTNRDIYKRNMVRTAILPARPVPR